jgi:hypothetical protein
MPGRRGVVSTRKVRPAQEARHAGVQVEPGKVCAGAWCALVDVSQQDVTTGDGLDACYTARAHAPAAHAPAVHAPAVHAPAVHAMLCMPTRCCMSIGSTRPGPYPQPPVIEQALIL